jgi:tripartite-type tricarboxylate transporter receptor subunit TctC
MLKIASGADITHVPYKGGAPAMTALVSGDVSMGIGNLAATMAFVKAGRVKVLALASGKRSRMAPDIPTIAETVKGVELQNWLGLVAPARNAARDHPNPERARTRGDSDGGRAAAIDR